MTSRLSLLTIDSMDPQALARFWAEVLGWHIGESTDTACELQNPEGHLPRLVFLKVPERKTVKNRLHIDVSPRDREQNEEVDRIVALGARRADVGQGDEVPWVVLADPEDNEFCVLRTRRPHD